jgi:hypothetical protein
MGACTRHGMTLGLILRSLCEIMKIYLERIKLGIIKNKYIC